MVRHTRVKGIRLIAEFTSRMEGVRILEGKSHSDKRGSFVKFDYYDDFISQANYLALSYTARAGTIRGFHFQCEPFAEEKIVTCVQGEIFDVLIDLRSDSTSYGQWTSYTLDDLRPLQIYIPKGVAHGFQTLRDNTITHYTLTSEHSSQHSFSINPLGDLEIPWPVEPTLISDKDSQGLSLIAALTKYSNLSS